MMETSDHFRESAGLRGLALHFLIGASALAAWAWIAAGTNRNRLFVYASDRVYADLALARNWVEQGFLGIGTELLPAHSDALWHVALATASKFGCSWVAAPLVVAFVLSLLGLLGALLLVRAIAPRAAWSAWTCVAWGLMLPAAADAFGGRPASAAAGFAALGIAVHARGLAPNRTALPLSAAFWIGLAALFRIEMLAIWIVLGAHALILSLARRVPMRALTVIIRFLNGGVLAAIFLCPILWWNVKAASVPWPPMPDAAMTLNALGGASIGAAFAGGFAEAMSEVFGGLTSGGALPLLFTIGGIGWLIGDLVRGRIDASATTLLVGLLVPPAFAPMYPFLGAEALPYLQRAVQPLWMLAAGYFVVRSAEAIANLAGRKALLREVPVFLAAVVLLGAMPVLAGMRDQVVIRRLQRSESIQAHEARAALADRLGLPDQREGGIASDEPGWLMFQRYAEVTDLSGRMHPILLNWIAGGTLRNETGLRNYLISRNTRAAVIWREPRDRFGRLFDCPPAAGSGPVVCRFTPNAIP